MICMVIKREILKNVGIPCNGGVLILKLRKGYTPGLRIVIPLTSFMQTKHSIIMSIRFYPNSNISSIFTTRLFLKFQSNLSFLVSKSPHRNPRNLSSFATQSIAEQNEMDANTCRPNNQLLSTKIANGSPLSGYFSFHFCNFSLSN